MLNIVDWLNAALSPRNELSDLIAELPASVSQRQAISLATNSDMESRVYALRAVSQDHSVGGNPHIALVLAQAGMEFCKLCYDRCGPGVADSFTFGVEQFASDMHRIYDRLDRHQDQLVFLDDAIVWLNDHSVVPQKTTDLRFLRIEALIELGKLEEADKALLYEQQQRNGKHHLYPLLKQRLEERLKHASELPSKLSLNDRGGQTYIQSLQNAIKGLSAIFSGDEFGILGTLKAQLDTEPGTLTPKEVIDKSNRLYDQLGGFLEQQAEGAGVQITLNSAIQRASSILEDEQNGKNPEHLQQALLSLEKVASKAGKLGFEDTVEDTLWPIYLCHKRLGNYDSAIDALQKIRQYVEQQRKRIEDPLKRAGIAQKYPFLYVELCALLVETGGYRELLSVIEEAKGRALTDKLAIEAHQENLYWPTEPAAEWLPQYLTELGVHYLTYLTDTDKTYAVLVGKDGSLHANIVPIGKEGLYSIRRFIDPNKWGKRISLLAPPNPDDIPQRLASVVGWLEPFVKSGLIREGEHICYSPEGLLHLFPFQYIDFLGQPFVRLCSLSKCHCAAMLWYATHRPVVKPQSSLSIVVPTDEEFEQNTKKVELFNRAPDWLAEHYKANLLRYSNADLPSIARQTLQNTVVHFATHGCFPDEIHIMPRVCY